MKFLHIADLHIGKRVCEHNLIEDQKHILTEIIEIAKREQPDAILIAGDVYDKSVPSAEAVAELDNFLVNLTASGTKVFVLSGNHDSAERIAFGGRLMEHQGVFMSPVYSGKFSPITLKDTFGEVDVWMLPFVRPADVRAYLETDAERDQVTNYTNAVAMSLSKMQFTEGRRNVLLAHQFVTGSERSDSEENVGGLDNVDISVFDKFDYVALGHIHKPQNVGLADNGTPRVRYSGTPLKYSLSEANHEKSVTIIELGDPQNRSMQVTTVPLHPLHDVRKIRGTFAKILSPEFRASQESDGHKLDDYVYVELTDEEDIPDAVLKIRSIYKNLMSLNYDNTRTRREYEAFKAVDVNSKSPVDLFAEFFKNQTGSTLEGEPLEFVEKLIKEIWKEEN